MPLYIRVLLLSLVLTGWAFSAHAEVRKSKAIPAESPRLAGAASEFTLADPRVALRKIEETGERRELARMPALIQAYRESGARHDGYGPAVRLAVLQALNRLQAPQSFEFLRTEFTATTDARYKKEMVLIFIKLGNPAVLPELKAYLIFLKEREPNDPLIRFQWQDLVRTVESAIARLEALP